METDDQDDAAEPWAAVAAALQELRQHGGASYAEIAMRVAAQRSADGASPSAARVARSTVFDAFRPDRARPNPRLIGEIVRALGEDAESVRRWRRRTARAIPVRTAADTVVTESALRTSTVPLIEAVADGAPGWWERHRFVVLVLAGSILLNLLGHRFVAVAQVPLFLDMIGTAVAAIALGPWHGALVAVTTNVAGVVLSAPGSVYFVLVNVAGALVWGYGVRRFAMARTLPRLLSLNLIVAVTCSIVATPLIVVLLGGHSAHALDVLAASWVAQGQSQIAAVFASNLVTSVADKLVAGFVVLAVLATIEAEPGRTTLPGDTVFARLRPLPRLVHPVVTTRAA
ncbi:MULTISPECIES: hypothetical protein [unclassified Microbacterium]|uniref:hypothetical protein n=1 Tax=unclassified Microbacterium TaxID=2609290 RepID=UPI003869AAF0